jgi:hypothetical protein
MYKLESSSEDSTNWGLGHAGLGNSKRVRYFWI